MKKLAAVIFSVLLVVCICAGALGEVPNITEKNWKDLYNSKVFRSLRNDALKIYHFRTDTLHEKEKDVDKELIKIVLCINGVNKNLNDAYEHYRFHESSRMSECIMRANYSLNNLKKTFIEYLKNPDRSFKEFCQKYGFVSQFQNLCNALLPDSMQQSISV